MALRKTSELGIARACEDKAQRIEFFLAGGKIKWAADDLGELPDAQGSYVAAKLLPAALEALFADELKFEDWFEKAIACSVPVLESVVEPWMHSMVELGKQSDPIAKAYIEEMVARTPSRLFALEAHGGASWRDAVVEGLGGKYRDWGSDIDELARAGYEPWAGEGSGMGHKPPKGVDTQGRAFAKLVESYPMEAANFINNCEDDARPYCMAYAAGELADEYLQGGDGDFSMLADMVRECSVCRLAIVEYFHSWMYALEKVCDEGRQEDQKIIDALIDAVPVNMFETACQHHAMKEGDWLAYMRRGSDLYKQAGARAQARVDSAEMEVEITKPGDEGLGPLDAALEKIRARKLPSKRKGL
jgi:hypothetical protein